LQHLEQHLCRWRVGLRAARFYATGDAAE
jgi:hypothetical protein